MGDFSREQFSELTAEIQKYLGWLKGNELVAKWEVDFRTTEWNSDEVGPTDVFLFMTEPADDQYTVMFQNTIAPVLWHEDLRDQLKGVFESGSGWAAGIADYFESMCLSIITPDAGAMHDAVVSVQQTGDQLAGAFSPLWTGLDVNSWKGGSSDAFQLTIENFQAVVNDQYLAYWREAENLFSASCAAVAQFQEGLLPFLTQVRDGLKQQLTAWASYGGEPNVLELPSKVVDALKVARSIVDLVPVVGKVDKFATITYEALDLFITKPPVLPDDFVFSTSDEIYLKATTTLSDEFQKGLLDTFDALRAERSSSVLENMGNVTPWLTPRFPGASDEPWQHEAEL